MEKRGLCVHRGREVGAIVSQGQAHHIFACNHALHRYADECDDCPHYEAISDEASLVNRDVIPEVCLPKPQSRIADTFVGYSGGVVDLYGMYHGASVFVVLSGPSAMDLDLRLFKRRGVCIFGVNNSPACLPIGIRPHLWTHTDPTHKFSPDIWRDPGIVKFSPIKEWGNGSDKRPRGISVRDESGAWVLSGDCAKEMPGVIGYRRNTTFQPEQWLTECTINRGNSKDADVPSRYPHCINTMFAIIKLSYVLGFRTVYLVGADFRMSIEKPYSFGQEKSKGGVITNNQHFRDMNTMFDQLKPHFDAAGFRVFNCYAFSGLQAFPHVPFEDAVQESTGSFAQGTLDTDGMYRSF